MAEKRRKLVLTPVNRRLDTRTGDYAGISGVEVGMSNSSMARRLSRYTFVCVTVTLQMVLGASHYKHALAKTEPAELSGTIVVSTRIERALDELRVRFPNTLVVGFEELFDPRPDKEPQIDLGPPGSSLDQALNRLRSIDSKYRIDLLQGRLVHVYPANKTADPIALLDIRLRQFSMPQDSCLQQAIENIDDWIHGYAPELVEFLAKRKRAWYRQRGQDLPGRAGEILGNCVALAAPGPVHRNITVRDALNLMAERSLQVSRGEVTPNDPIYQPFKPLAWKFRFRRAIDTDTDTGLGGVPLFQTF